VQVPTRPEFTGFNKGKAKKSTEPKRALFSIHCPLYNLVTIAQTNKSKAQHNSHHSTMSCDASAIKLESEFESDSDQVHPLIAQHANSTTFQSLPKPDGPVFCKSSNAWENGIELINESQQQFLYTVIDSESNPSEPNGPQMAIIGAFPTDKALFKHVETVIKPFFASKSCKIPPLFVAPANTPRCITASHERNAHLLKDQKAQRLEEFVIKDMD
jgi:hypothetical protein